MEENFGKTEPRYYQISAEEALNFRVIDLFREEEQNGKKLLSRADILLITTLFTDGLAGFLNEYKGYVKKVVSEKGYNWVHKPHYYLKNLLD